MLKTLKFMNVPPSPPCMYACVCMCMYLFVCACVCVCVCSKHTSNRHHEETDVYVVAGCEILGSKQQFVVNILIRISLSDSKSDWADSCKPMKNGIVLLSTDSLSS